MPEAKLWPDCLASSTLSIDGGARGDAVQMEQLECAQAEGDQNLQIELGIGAFEKQVDLVVELNLPAEHSQHQGRDQIAVGGRRAR